MTDGPNLAAKDDAAASAVQRFLDFTRQFTWEEWPGDVRAAAVVHFESDYEVFGTVKVDDLLVIRKILEALQASGSNPAV